MQIVPVQFQTSGQHYVVKLVRQVRVVRVVQAGWVVPVDQVVQVVMLVQVQVIRVASLIKEIFYTYHITWPTRERVVRVHF